MLGELMISCTSYRQNTEFFLMIYILEEKEKGIEVLFSAIVQSQYGKLYLHLLN